MKVMHTVEHTGEVLDLDVKSPEDIIDALLMVNSYIAAYEHLKAQLNDLAVDAVDTHGSLEHGGHRLVYFTTQRMQYDKAVLREVFDPDELDVLMEPAKGKIDRYIRDHLEELGEFGGMLRDSMKPIGRPYRTVRLERVERAA